jgi:GTP-binding protein HflX
VGFISDLPTMLVAAFRATLEEVIEADLILHVRDMSHEDTDAQLHDVGEVLQSLDVDPDDSTRLVEVWNKIDRLDPDARERVMNLAARRPAERRPVLVSALSGEGIDALFATIEQHLTGARITMDLVLDAADGAGVSWLHRNTEVMAKHADESGQVHLTVRADAAKAEQVRARFGAAVA